MLIDLNKKMEIGNMQSNWSALLHRYMSRNIQMDPRPKNPAIASAPDAAWDRPAPMQAQTAMALRLPFIPLPDEINLSNPTMAKAWYDTVHFTMRVDGKTQTLHTQPLVFYAAVPKDAPHPKLGEAFIRFMTSKAGQAMFRETGYNPPKGGDLS